MKIQFAKLRNGATIPTKEKENLGYDVYACFDTDILKIKKGEIKMIPTGIASVIDEDYGIIVKERGSTGSKGLSVRCGVIDSNYRGEWFIAINNTTDHDIVIAKPNVPVSMGVNDVLYPYTKAIAQAIIVPNILADIKEITVEELEANKTSRGKGKLGSSGK